MKYLVIFLSILMMAHCAVAQPLTANAYQKSVYVSSSNLQEGMAFPITVRNLLIINGDSSDGCWIDIETSTRTSAQVIAAGALDVEGYFFLPAGDILEFYNYMTDGISIICAGGLEASPVTVIATY